MVSSWNWLLLADFATIKPTTLPENDPADFTYFFDTSRRRTCYLAPERFVPCSSCLIGKRLCGMHPNELCKTLKITLGIFQENTELLLNGYNQRCQCHYSNEEYCLSQQILTSLSIGKFLAVCDVQRSA